VKSQCHRTLLAGFTAAVVSVSVGAVAATAMAPAKKAPAKKAPAKKPAAKGGDAKAGKIAFKNEGCAGCHKTQDYTDSSATLGPDLSGVGAHESAAEIKAYIVHPSKAGSIMPHYKADTPAKKKNLEDMTAYLVSQKKK